MRPRHNGNRNDPARRNHPTASRADIANAGLFPSRHLDARGVGGTTAAEYSEDNDDLNQSGGEEEGSGVHGKQNAPGGGEGAD